jgi:hypothetical protein
VGRKCLAILTFLEIAAGGLARAQSTRAQQNQPGPDEPKVEAPRVSSGGPM